MNERQSDFEWLQQFARAGSQTAFRDLVRRHIDLVFATALRKIGDAGGAEEISQNVFGVLAKKAWQFAPDDSLPAWLHKTTLLESQAWQRGDMRHRQREQIAAELGTTMKTPDAEPAFRALVPLLDEALLSLREKDREALLLRYYESRSLKDVGAALGVSDDTAQKRVQTALEKLSQFFQRRGFKTATVAATTAALQQTAISATSTTVSVVFNAAMQAAPPVLVGLSAWLARFASLSKVQTAAVCVAIAAGPLAWQINEQRAAANEAEQMQQQLAGAQSDHAAVLAENQQLAALAEKLEAEAIANQAAIARQTEDLAKFEAWKKRIRAQMLADDYQWPEDSPFVRIPKALLPQLRQWLGVSSPGVLSQPMRELLGLAPEERLRLEQTLQNHFATMNSLLAAQMVETNQASGLKIPEAALAGWVWVVPPLAAPARESADNVLATFKHTLGTDRWPLVEKQFESGWDLHSSLNLNSITDRQEIAVWISDKDGFLLISCGQAGKRASGGDYSSISVQPVELKWFHPNASETDRWFGKVVAFRNMELLPETIRATVRAWIETEAARRLQKEATR